jgi:hypothetical protein
MIKFILSAFLIFGFFVQLFGQCLNGEVFDDSGEPLIYASIYLETDNNILAGTTSDYNGQFQICVDSTAKFLLVIEYIGKVRSETLIDFASIDQEEKSKYILQNDPEANILACPVITYNKTFEEAKIVFNKREFELMAGAYEDPARLIMKYPGFANSNDQANGIINMGMAPAFTKWSLNGVEIVNPNHLSNAGTLTDLSSASAGGVNALSGNIMERFAYLSNPNGPAYANALSAFADIQTSEIRQNYISLGLLGLESGWNFGSREKGPSLSANYRYSFVGLLSAIGVDFGGESIAFQDLFIQTHLLPESSQHQLSFNYLFASNKNDHTPVSELSETMLFKDLTDIHFKGRIQVLGINYAWKNWIQNSDLHFNVSYSFKDDNRKAEVSELILDSFPGFYNYSIFEEKLLQSKLSSSFKIRQGYLNTGFVHTFANLNQTLQKNIIQAYAMNAVQQHLRAFINIEIEKYRMYNTSIGLNVLHDINTGENLLEPYFAYKKFLTSTLFTRLSYEKSSQSAFLNHIAMSNPEDIKRMKSHAFQFQIAHEWGFGINLTGNFLYDIAHNNELFYHGFNEFGFEEEIELIYDGSARNYGIAGYVQQNFGRHDGLGVQGNVSVFKTQFLWQEDWFDGRYDHGYAFNFSISKSFGKINSSSWTGNVNIAYHQRGGIYSNRIDASASETSFYTQLDYSKPYKDRAAAYQRIDFRVVLQKNLRSRYFRNQIISLDMQNLLNKQNEGFLYYDQLTGEVQNQLQLGLIPVLSYKLIFRKT